MPQDPSKPAEAAQHTDSISAQLIVGDSRSMTELREDSIDLIVTSPPYWHIKDYGTPGQIGYGQDLHAYLRDLYRVWAESFRVLRPGRRLCINIGDQFSRATLYGRYKIIPLHAEIIAQCEALGFDYLGAIIWQKKTTLNTTGGAPIMGSFPYPPNGMVEIDYEFILLFKKPGPAPKVSPAQKEASKLTQAEWKAYFSGHWRFGGARQLGHEAMFPEELPARLIRMFSFLGETVLDPFAGSGTTLQAALRWGRRAIGYEINPQFVPLIRQKVAETQNLFTKEANLEVIERKTPLPPLEPVPYEPRIQNSVLASGARKLPNREPFFRVKGVTSDLALILEGGQQVELAGIYPVQGEAIRQYLQAYIVGKRVHMRLVAPPNKALVYLKNGLQLNRYLIRRGLAVAAEDPPGT